MESNFDHMCQFWPYQSQKGYSVDYYTRVYICSLETVNTSFIVPGEIPFRHSYTSVIKEFKHCWRGDISSVK